MKRESRDSSNVAAAKVQFDINANLDGTVGKADAKPQMQAVGAGTHECAGSETTNARDLLVTSIEKLAAWIERHDYKGYEPFDGLSSYLRPLTCGNWFAERALQQVILRCPFHIRPLLGVKPLHSTKGMGFLARGYLRMFALTGDSQYKDKATYCLDWLIENRSPGYSGFCWGNQFDYAARPFQLPKSVPTVVWTSHIGQAFLDAHEILDDPGYLEVASGVCEFIMKDLSREKTDSGTCISYVPFKQMSLHNSNMLAAAMLARTAGHTDDKAALDAAREAMQYSCSRQLDNGGWYYGEAATYHWIDNWHTAYNLDSLKCYMDAAHDRSFAANLHKGIEFYRNSFFQKSGKPNYYADRLHLVDIQCASQAIDTLSNFSAYDSSCLGLALKVATWTIRNMQDTSGYFYYRKLRWKTVKIPMIHWGQATMFCALTHLLSKIGREVDHEG